MFVIMCPAEVTTTKFSNREDTTVSAVLPADSAMYTAPNREGQAKWLRDPGPGLSPSGCALKEERGGGERRGLVTLEEEVVVGEEPSEWAAFFR